MNFREPPVIREMVQPLEATVIHFRGSVERRLSLSPGQPLLDFPAQPNPLLNVVGQTSPHPFDRDFD